jgi:hypothetical protein
MLLRELFSLETVSPHPKAEGIFPNEGEFGGVSVAVATVNEPGAVRLAAVRAIATTDGAFPFSQVSKASHVDALPFKKEWQWRETGNPMPARERRRSMLSSQAEE